MNRPLTVAVAGCGSRGQDTYSKILVTMPEKAKIVAAADLDPEKLAETIASKAPIAVRQGKACVNFGMDADMYTAARFEREAMSLCAASEDKSEGMTAFVEKRAPEFGNK